MVSQVARVGFCFAESVAAYPVKRLLSGLQILGLTTLALLSLSSMLCAQDLHPMATTYSAMLANNSSAAPVADSLTGTTSDSQNVSKIPIPSVLPSGVATRIYAHFMAWFGKSGHQDVGYTSADATQVQKQVEDMVSRGISGAIINWQGPSDYTDQTTSIMMREAENRNGSFEFAVEEDSEAVQECAQTTSCNLKNRVIADLNYVLSTYSRSAAYMTFQGRPVIFLYGMEKYNLDWNGIQKVINGNPVLVFRQTAS